MRDGLSQDQVALVLRRASELDKQFGPPHDAGIDEVALEQAAVEAGLSPEAVHRALAELRSGVLDGPSPRHRGLLGDATVTVWRSVAGEVAEVEGRLHAFLHDQLFDMRRDRGTTTAWVRRRDLQACTRRAIDHAIQRRLVLRDVHHVELSIAGYGGWVDVSLRLDVLAVRHKQGTIAGSTAVAGMGMTLTTAAFAPRPVFVVTTAAGAGLMGLGHWAGRRLYRDRVGEIESGVNGMLDRLEQRGNRTRTGGRRLYP